MFDGKTKALRNESEWERELENNHDNDKFDKKDDTYNMPYIYVQTHGIKLFIQAQVCMWLGAYVYA